VECDSGAVAARPPGSDSASGAQGVAASSGRRIGARVAGDFDHQQSRGVPRVLQFLAFYNEHNGNIVSKVTGFGFSRLVDRDFSRYTEAVSKRHMGYAASLQYCPVIFQAYVAKQFELRVTVVGKQVFAAEIHSQLTNHTRYDWRRYDLSRTPHLRHELPPGIQQKCVELVERLELSYGAIDMVLTPEGQYVFLEINPNGQYLWIEEQTGLPISAALCDLLMNESRAETA
jgi:glutathione synthase/RimK-type ligase-like ATP-grasp enzyme